VKKPRRSFIHIFGEEGAVPGIVLQDEEPDQEEGGHEVQDQGEEEGVVEGKVGQIKEAQKGEKRVRHLAEASPGVGFGVGFYKGDPVLGFYFVHLHHALFRSAAYRRPFLNETYKRRDRGSTHDPKEHAALKTTLSWMRKIATLRGFRFYRVRAEKGIQVKR
jgi:hypothetical protein